MNLWQTLWRSMLAVIGAVAYVGLTGVLGGYTAYCFTERHYAIGVLLTILLLGVLASFHVYEYWRRRKLVPPRVKR